MSHRDLRSLGALLPSGNTFLKSQTDCLAGAELVENRASSSITQLAWISTSSTDCLVCLPHGGVTGHPSIKAKATLSLE